MILKYRLEDEGGISEISAVDDEVYNIVRSLAIRVGVIHMDEDGGEPVCTLAIERMLKTYKEEHHGGSGLTNAVEAELKVLHELHPNRVHMRRVCRAHKGISCDYAVACGNGKQGQHDLCIYPNVCELSKEEAF